MGITKKLAVYAILLTIALIFLFTAVLDFSRFLEIYDLYNSYPGNLIKRVNVILAMALVWLAGTDSLSQSDNRLMKIVFAVICVGEALFMLYKPFFAITAFLVCQYLLTLRHSNGISKKLMEAPIKQKLKLILPGLILASIILAVTISISPTDNYNNLSIIAVCYWIILSISLWTALGNLTLSLSPKTNSRMTALGMICFYCCDICVGLDTLLGGGTAWLLANSFIWIFYTPAITLLALSCYKYEGTKQEH